MGNADSVHKGNVGRGSKWFAQNLWPTHRGFRLATAVRTVVGAVPWRCSNPFLAPLTGLVNDCEERAATKETTRISTHRPSWETTFPLWKYYRYMVCLPLLRIAGYLQNQERENLISVKIHKKIQFISGVRWFLFLPGMFVVGICIMIVIHLIQHIIERRIGRSRSLVLLLLT